MPAIVCQALLLIANAPIHLAHQIALGVHVGDKSYAHEPRLIYDSREAPDLVSRHTVLGSGRWRWIGTP